MTFARKQQLYFDGVEESAKFINITYSRMLSSVRSQDPMKDMDDFRSSALLLDSWVIVDLAKRIRTLLEGMPGLKQTPDTRAFLIRTSDVPSFRHYIQHLESETTNIAESGRPIWGSISWVQLLPDEKFIVRIYVPGRIAKCEGIPAVNPAGREFHGDIDHFELTVEDRTLNVSELVRDILGFSVRFSKALKLAEQSGETDNNGIVRFELAPES